MNDRNSKPNTTVELHIFGDAAEVEATAEMLRQTLKVLEESPDCQDPDLGDEERTRVRRKLTVQKPSEDDQ